MPSYPIPPWLVPQSPVGPYLQGTALGARVGGEQAALEMQARQQALAEAARERSAALAEQDYTMRKAQADAEMAIRQRTASDIAAKEAMRMQAIKDIEAETGALGNQATPQDMARIYARHFPALTAGTGATALPGMMRNMTPAEPTMLDIGGKQYPAVRQPSGNITFPRTTTAQERLSPEKKETLDTLKTDYKNAMAQIKAAEVALAKDPLNPAVLEFRRTSLRAANAARSILEKYIKSLGTDETTESDLPGTAELPATATKKFTFDPKTGAIQ